MSVILGIVIGLSGFIILCLITYIYDTKKHKYIISFTCRDVEEENKGLGVSEFCISGGDFNMKLVVAEIEKDENVKDIIITNIYKVY